MGSSGEMSFAQRRLWFLDQLHPGSADYLLPLALRLRGAVDAGALDGALRAVAERHEVLRTRYPAVDGDPRATTATVVLDRVDLTGRGPSEVDAWLRAEVRRPVDVTAEAPLRARLATLGPDEHLLVVVVHHIAFDFGSWPIFTRELAACYGERTGHGPADLPPLPCSYADHARGQAERLAGERLRRGLAHWTTRLADLPPLRLPADRPRPARWSGAAGISRFTVAADLLAEVDAFAKRNRATRFMVLLAAFQALLARYSGQTDFAVGAPVTGRDRVAAEALIGLFVNTVALRADLSGEPTFADVVARVRAGVPADLRYAEVPFDRVVSELAPTRDLSRNPLYQVTFSLLAAGAPRTVLPGLDVAMLPALPSGLPVDLVLDLIPVEGGELMGRVQYAEALFDPDTVDQLGVDYTALLRALLAEPGVPVAEHARVIEPLPGKERARLLAIGNDTAAPEPDGTVVDLIAAQTRRTPDAPAVRSHDGALTYAELEARVERLACRLRGLGIGRGSVVGVHLDRGVLLPVAFLAVLKANAAYVPLDPDYPARRLEFMLADAGATALITERALAGAITAGAARTVLLDTDTDTDTDADTDTRTDTGPGGDLVAAKSSVPTPDDLAYIIYTSGSTGLPKGVMVDHRGLTGFVAAMAERPGMAPGAAVIGLTTVSFDPSVLELYLPLVVGAHVVIASAEQARDPQRLADLIADTTPRVLQATPVTLRMLLDSGWSAPAGLTVLAGGEKLQPELVRRLSAHGARVWDLYGPTETTVWATTARMDADGHVLDWAAKANSTVYLLDADLEPVPENETGEIYLGGVGVAPGYRDRPGVTAEHFLPDPFASVAGARMYRTGDLGRRGDGGSVAILGRADHQVKIRGHRMEPGEIEAALLEHPRVRAAVVHPVPAGAGELQLVGYLVVDGEPPGADELRPFLLRTLPDYMAPAAYVVLDALPLTANGKVDRAALPLPDAPTSGAGRAEPRTPEEQAVADVWREALGTDAFGVHDNFFDVGGHSLLATRVAVRLRAAIGVDVAVRALFDHGTVAALAAALPRYPRLSDPTAALVPRARRRSVPAKTY